MGLVGGQDGQGNLADQLDEMDRLGRDERVVDWKGRGESYPVSRGVWGGRSRSGDGRSRGNVGEIENRGGREERQARGNRDGEGVTVIVE